MNSDESILKPDASCEEVRHCFPQYVKNAARFSEGERGTVIQHLSECSECRAAYNKLLPEQPANTDV